MNEATFMLARQTGYRPAWRAARTLHLLKVHVSPDRTASSCGLIRGGPCGPAGRAWPHRDVLDVDATGTARSPGESIMESPRRTMQRITATLIGDPALSSYRA